MKIRIINENIQEQLEDNTNLPKYSVVKDVLNNISIITDKIDGSNSYSVIYLNDRTNRERPLHSENIKYTMDPAIYQDDIDRIKKIYDEFQN